MFACLMFQNNIASQQQGFEFSSIAFNTGLCTSQTFLCIHEQHVIKISDPDPHSHLEHLSYAKLYLVYHLLQPHCCGVASVVTYMTGDLTAVGHLHGDRNEYMLV